MSDRRGRDISPTEFDRLRQMLWDFPERIALGVRDTLPGQLFFRQLLHVQVGFQRTHSLGFIREAALLVELQRDHPLRRLFETKTGLQISDFIDLALVTFTAMTNGERAFDLSSFEPLRKSYDEANIEAFFACVSRTYPQLIEFFRALPYSQKRVSSEYYEFPVISRYPFLRTNNLIECWHPAAFFRGFESLVHSVLSEAGSNYIEPFSEIFENHVISQSKKLNGRFYSEDLLRTFVPIGTKVPDGLASFPGCNVFIESKSGLFDESVMTVGHSEMFARKTRSLQTAFSQGWSISGAIRLSKSAPRDVLDAPVDYLLVVTNKELSASRGTSLAAMYPEATFDFAHPDREQYLPLANIYVLSIEDFERLVAAVESRLIELPTFLNACVVRDSKAETAVHFFEQHLDAAKLPRGHSMLVKNAVEASKSRLSAAFGV